MFEVQNFLLTFVGMKRIFHIVSHFDMGGAERVALNIAKSKNPDFEYHMVEVIRGRSAFTRQFIQEMEQANIHYHRSPIPVIHFHYVFEKLATLLFPLWFYWLYRKYYPYMIHCHCEIPELSIYHFYHLFHDLDSKTAVYRTIHNTSLWHGMKKTGVKVEEWLNDEGANIAISESVYKNFKKEYGYEAPIIYNGVEPSLTKKIYPQLKKDKINILFAGRMEEQKGIKHLVSIIQNLKNDSRYHFHIIGEGRLKPLLVNELKEQENVSINPPLYGLQSYLGSFDYLLMPSEHEGLAMLSIEASMEGTPVIINKALGLEETLPSDWPLKVSDNNLQAYLHLFEEVIPNGNREEWGKKAQEYASENFSIQKMRKAYEKKYGERHPFGGMFRKDK